MKKVSLLSAAVYCAASLSFATVSSHADDAVYPNENWAIEGDPSKEGFSQAELDQLTNLLKTMNTQSMHVSIGGKQVYAYGDITEVDYLASVRKSLLAIMYGKYIKDGTIKRDATLADMSMDDIGGLLDTEKQATVKDIISARSGVYHVAANGGDSSADAPTRGSQKPGSYYLYNNWDFNTAGAIFEKMTGKGIFQELNDQLAIPLGFEEFTLVDHKKSGNPERSNSLAYHMNLSARDMARVGHLMLMKGKWGDKQLVDESWVAEMVHPHTQNEEMNPAGTKASGMEYGYMWWVFDDDKTPLAYKGAYAGRGHYGQYLAVFPALNMVISHKTSRVGYSSPEEYNRVRVTWGEFEKIVSHLVIARSSPE